MSDRSREREEVLARARERQQTARVPEAVESPTEQPSMRQRAKRHAKWRAKQALRFLPGSLQRSMTKKRHLAHVTVNMGHLTPAPLLGAPMAGQIGWVAPEGLPEPPPPASWAWEPLDTAGQAQARAWLEAGTYDDDEILDRRMDGQGDELGRSRTALATRLALAEDAIRRRTTQPSAATGSRVLVDARSLQSAAFGARGIGRFARAAVLALREEVGDANVDLLVDMGLEDLPAEIAGTCRQVTRISENEASTYAYLLQPSPMTASPEPLIPVLTSSAHKTAIVFDYIPMDLPDVYVPHVAARLEYAAGLDALRCYDEFVCISHLVKDETARILDRPDGIDATVAWPAAVLPADAHPAQARERADGPIILMTGDDPRKNTFGGLAGIGAATSGDDTRDVAVLGMAGQGVRVHHWSIAAMMRPGECTTLERIPDDEMAALLARASLVVVPSFDEGLSLPVIEAALAGAPVVASDIPSHRELIGTGSHLADPASPASIERAVTKHRGRTGTAAQQWQRLAQHQHEDLEHVITESTRTHRPGSETTESPIPAAVIDVEERTLRVGVATPWSPQKSGVADYSVATISALAEIADVTVYTTSDARVDDAIASRPVGEAAGHADDHDVFLTVLGNSHFHLPHLDLMERIDTVALSHDTRMIEFYMALRGPGGVANLMLRGTGRRELHPDLDEQVNDMRLLENAGFWEIARRARMLITHSPCAAPTISAQTGRPVEVLPFANYRRPSVDRVTEPMRAQARRNTGMWDGTVHLASFGYIDTRTKLTDTVVESAAWLQQWGHKVHLHLVGSASKALEEELTQRATSAGLTGFTITGYVPESTFRDYLLGADLGIQLRVSPLLGVSGPLADMAAYGTPALASTGLAIDVGTPDFIERLPDDVSPVMVAEAIEHALANPRSLEEREAMRQQYLAEKSPARYAEQLIALLDKARRSGEAT